MIRNFADRVELIWSGQRSRKLPSNIQAVAFAQTAFAEPNESSGRSAGSAGSRLEALKGERAGQHSVRINDRWRICFIWSEGGPVDVEIGGCRTPSRQEILLEEFLKPISLSQNALARAIHVPPRRISRLVLGKRSVTADTDLRLATLAFRMGSFSAWENDYDLMQQRRQIDTELQTITPRAASQPGGVGPFLSLRRIRRIAGVA
ncbi:MAG: HigA family addiction module antitoxin [Rhodospirillales bacterium]